MKSRLVLAVLAGLALASPPGRAALTRLSASLPGRGRPTPPPPAPLLPGATATDVAEEFLLERKG